MLNSNFFITTDKPPHELDFQNDHFDTSTNSQKTTVNSEEALNLLQTPKKIKIEKFSPKPKGKFTPSDQHKYINIDEEEDDLDVLSNEEYNKLTQVPGFSIDTNSQESDKYSTEDI